MNFNKKKRKLAATIEQQFDVYVYNMLWHDKKKEKKKKTSKKKTSDKKSTNKSSKEKSE